MANASIGGLVSGLDTATIISQLMQLEARPQTMLKSRVSTEQRAVTALQTLNAKVAAFGTKAAELAKSTGWTPSKATSDNENVTVAVGPAALPGATAIEVVGVATASRATYATSATATTAGVSGSSVTITYSDPTKTSRTLTVADGSLQSVAHAINSDTAAGLQATLVRAGGTDAAPTYQLVVTSKSTGQSSGFTIDDGSGNFLGGTTAASTGGTDATIKINGTAVTQASNTFKGVMPGVDVTLLSGATGPANITVERDVATLSESVKTMVDQLNAAIAEIGSLTAYDAATKKGGLLSGDGTLRTVRNQLIESVTAGVALPNATGGTTTGSLATIGIQVDRYGKLTFDEAKFQAAYAANSTDVVNRVAGADATSTTVATDGLAGTLEKLSKQLSDSYTGTVTLSIKSRQSAIKGWEDDIADWDVRLAARQTTLQRQYTALESALGKLQSQGNWLAGQIASLPQMSSGQ